MIAPMTEECARKIAEWKYAGAYAIYSFSGDADAMRELMNGEYYVQADEAGEPEGFFCFGASARIPTCEEGAYADGALDIGLGMRPDRCGRGGGAAFVREGMDFAQSAFGAAHFRLTVAAFNVRAIRVYEKVGFRETGIVHLQSTGREFRIMEYLPAQMNEARRE